MSRVPKSPRHRQVDLSAPSHTRRPPLEYLATHPAVIAFTAAAVLALSGCAIRERVVTVIVPPPPLADRIPAQLLSCRGRPAVGAVDRQSDVARYVVDLDAAGADCRNKLQGIEEIVREDGKKEKTK